MKVTLEHHDSLETCDLCERKRVCATLSRNAKRHERENFYLNICQECSKTIDASFESRRFFYPDATAEKAGAK